MMIMPPPFRDLPARVLLPLALVAATVLTGCAMLYQPTRSLVESPAGGMLIFYAAVLGVLLIVARRAHLDWNRLLGPTKTAVILSSAFFEILHVELIGHFFFGVVMAALYVRTQSLWMAILAHAVNNGIVVALSLPAALDGTPPATPTMEEFRAEWPYAAAGLLIGAAGLAWFWRRYAPRGAWTLPYSVEPPFFAPSEPIPPLAADAPVGEAS